jgi:RHS repeat-associated protein
MVMQRDGILNGFAALTTSSICTRIILRLRSGQALGSIVATTNISGALTSSRGYRAYGNYRRGGDLPTDYRFTGQKQDASGLVYMNARYYDPTLGQFISPDTLVPDAGVLIDYNRYGYARGNPMRFSDPSGHCATLSSGEADENDDDCWRLANTIAIMWGDTDYWQERFGDIEVWENIASSGLTANFFQDELSRYLNSEAHKAFVVQQEQLYEQHRIPRTPAYPVDAIAVGLAGNIDVPSIVVGPLGIGGTAGTEIVAHRDGETAVYPFAGGGITVGAGVNAKVYVAQIRDLEKLEDYEGLSITADVTVSLGPFGITYGSLGSPSGAHGEFFGLAPGAGLSVSASGSYYFSPIFSWR